MTGGKLGNFEIFNGTFIGGRPEQEDRFFSSEANFRNSDEAANFLTAHMARVARETHTNSSGSSASLAVITPDDRLTIAHVADSPVRLYSRNTITGEIEGFDLIQPHNGANIAEARRLGIQVKPNSRAITRNLGALKWGLSHDADISVYDLKQFRRPNQELFLCVSSDGVDHAGINSAQEHAKQNLQGRAVDGDEIVNRMIVNSGYDTADNVTAVVAKIPPAIGSTGLAIGVFDGNNGGSETSQYACNSFLDALRAVPSLGVSNQRADHSAPRVVLEDLLLTARYERTQTFYEGTGTVVDCITFPFLTPAYLQAVKKTLNALGIESEEVREGDESGFKIPGLRVKAGMGGQNMMRFHNMVAKELNLAAFRPNRADLSYSAPSVR